MRKQEKASLSITKIICISIILILISGIGVMAVNANLGNVKILLQNGYEMSVITSKTKVSEILEENNIILEENQKTVPDVDSEIAEGEIIKIVEKTQQEVQISKISEEGVETSLNQLLQNYAPITEKIVVEQEAIPYETVTKNETENSENVTNKVLQEGKEGKKEKTYKVKYQNEIEIEKTLLSENVIKEPVNKIVQIQKKATTSRGSATPRTSEEKATKSNTTEKTTYKVTAYCSCAKCCGKTTGTTASGTTATPGRTAAASAKFAFGTKLNIGGHVYTVEDRGGAINGNRIDIYVGSHAEALQWGVRYLTVNVVN